MAEKLSIENTSLGDLFGKTADGATRRVLHVATEPPMDFMVETLVLADSTREYPVASVYVKGPATIINRRVEYVPRAGEASVLVHGTDHDRDAVPELHEAAVDLANLALKYMQPSGGEM